MRKQRVERHNPRVGELKKQREERQPQSRRIQGNRGRRYTHRVGESKVTEEGDTLTE